MARDYGMTRAFLLARGASIALRWVDRHPRYEGTWRGYNLDEPEQRIMRWLSDADDAHDRFVSWRIARNRSLLALWRALWCGAIDSQSARLYAQTIARCVEGERLCIAEVARLVRQARQLAREEDLRWYVPRARETYIEPRAGAPSALDRWMRKERA